ncbi:hypothetical protein SAY87_011923 [Trapa incisa]|uniref:TIR domain-containing protein n=1 Tax=Trapa incisa TaxID=236973 RepID=A0AAN7JBS9_9MYRT|nr:hypothetical protein SAY87_011923 [Trapa incisa]
MVDSKKTIVSIFYKVFVDDVKLNSPKYKRFMEKHEKRYGKEKVDKWKAVLKDATEKEGRLHRILQRLHKQSV